MCTKLLQDFVWKFKSNDLTLKVSKIFCQLFFDVGLENCLFMNLGYGFNIIFPFHWRSEIF